MARRINSPNAIGLTPQETADAIAVLPLGATEQHGPHLPYETDTLIADAIVDRLIARLPQSAPVFFLPTEDVTYSPEHLHARGSKSLDWDVAIRRWIDIGEDLRRAGVSKLVILNAHGGNSPLMAIVATELRYRFAMLAVTTSWLRFGLPEGIMSPEEKHLDIHGGLIETSVMLAACPERVAMEKARDFPSREADYIRDYRHLRAYGPHAFGWLMSDLSKEGVTGNAAAATAETGEAILAHAVTGLVELLEDVAKHPGF